MKKLKMIRFSEDKELTKGEQKNLRGGTNGMSYGCTCTCVRSTGQWTSYTSDGSCPYSLGEAFVGYHNCASGVAICE